MRKKNSLLTQNEQWPPWRQEAELSSVKKKKKEKTVGSKIWSVLQTIIFLWRQKYFINLKCPKKEQIWISDFFIFKFQAPDIPPANVTGYNISSTSIAVEFQIYSAEQLNGIIRHYVLKIFKANAVNSTVRTEFFPTQTKRKQREVSNTTYSVRVTLEDLEEYTMYSMQAAFFTIKKGPYSAVFNVSTDEGGMINYDENVQ